MGKKKKHKTTFKKPPDKYNCIKVPFSKIIIDETKKNKIFNCVVRTNKITIKTYQLLRLWILDKYHKKESIPIITENTIKMAQKSILEKSAGPKPKGNNLALFNEFKNFHSFTLENGIMCKNVKGIVRRAFEGKDKKKIYGIQFTEIDKNSREDIISYLFKVQRDRRQKGLS